MVKNELDFRSSTPLYRQLSKILIKEIALNKYKTDDKFYTEKEIQAKYKVSTTTAKFAVNELVYRDILYRRPRKGTFVKDISGLNERKSDIITKSNTVAIVLSKLISDSVLNPFYSVIIEEIESVMFNNGFHLSIFIVDNSAKKNKMLLSKIQNSELSGIYLIGGSLDKNLIRNIIDTGIHTVVIDGPIRDKNLNSIVIDDVDGAFQAVKYLIENGHRKIAYIGGGFKDRASKLRLEGYKKALLSAVIPVDENLIIMGKAINFENGFNCAEQLLENRKMLPTAIFAVNDVVAIGVMKYILGNNFIIPDDISIIGFDDIEIASHVYPRLTTMKSNRNEIGKIAAEMMVTLIKGETIQEKERIFKVELIERESVKKIK